MCEDELADWLRAAGAEEGEVLLVHASLSAFGVVVGGEQAVIGALRRAVGPRGTIVMPAQSWQLCDPDYLDDPRLDAQQREAVRRALPAFDPDLTPTRTMGAVAELFRTLPGSRRSPHPHRSFSASGPAAETVTAEQALGDPFGEASPLARLYSLDAKVALLGVGYESCTALHLAEARSGRDRGRTVANGAPMRLASKRTWVTWQERAVDDADFPSIGEAFERVHGVVPDRVGEASCRLISLRALVDFAIERMDDVSESESACKDGKILRAF